MKLPSLRRLGQRGFHPHFVAPLLAIVAVGGIGAAYLALSSAATASYYTTTCTKTTSGAPNSAYNECTQDAQILLNAAQHHDATNELGLAVYAGSTFNYGTAAKPMVYLLMNGLYGTYTAKAVAAATGTSSGQLTSGNTGSWQHLCTIAATKGLNSDSSVLNFGASGTHGVTGGSVTSLKAPVSNSAAFSYACGKPSSTPPATGTTTTSSSGTLCTSYTISTTSNPTPSGSPCVYYIQTILNGANASNPFSYNSYASKYDSYYKISSNGPIGGVNSSERNYNQETSVRIMAFQATVAYNGTPLSVTGTTDAMTWDSLCALAHTYGSGNSYIQSAITVSKATDSGCSKVTGKITADPHQTTPPPLSCAGGSSMNSAKTACACPSGQTYSGGKCVTAAAGRNNGSAPPTGATCTGGTVKNSNGICECTSNNTWDGYLSKCVPTSAWFGCVNSGTINSSNQAPITITCAYSGGQASSKVTLPAYYTKLTATTSGYKSADVEGDSTCNTIANAYNSFGSAANLSAEVAAAYASERSYIASTFANCFVPNG